MRHPLITETLCAGSGVGLGAGCCCADGAAMHQAMAMALPRRVLFISSSYVGSAPRAGRDIAAPTLVGRIPRALTAPAQELDSAASLDIAGATPKAS